MKMTEYLRIKVCDGKYELVQDSNGTRVLRHGEEWRDETGDHFILSMAQEIEHLRDKVEQLEDELLCSITE